MSNDLLTIRAKVNWCDPHRPNKMSGKYQTELVLLDDDSVKALKDQGFTVNFDTKNNSDDEYFKGWYIKAKSDSPVRITDVQGNNLPSNLFIGNGTTAEIIYRAKDWTHKESGKSGRSMAWLGAKVVELVKYDPDAANKAKADALLDKPSGEGFVFGGDAESTDTSEIDGMFDESNTAA